LSNIKALSKKVGKDDKNDFVIHVEGEYDYRLRSEDRDLIFKHMILSTKGVTEKDIDVYGVQGGRMEDYITTEEEREKGYAKGLPPDEYKLYGEAAVNVQSSWSESSKPEPKKEGGFLRKLNIFSKSKKTEEGKGVQSIEEMQESIAAMQQFNDASPVSPIPQENTLAASASAV
jgi:hypothetical protein